MTKLKYENYKRNKTINFFYILLINGILIPFLTLTLANKAVHFAIYYLGEQLESGLKLSDWIISSWYYLSGIYIVFGISFYLSKNFIFKLLWTILFISLPILIYQNTSVYDYYIKLSFAAYHLTYYILFFISNTIFYIVSKIVNKAKETKSGLDAEALKELKHKNRKRAIIISSAVLVFIVLPVAVLMIKTKWEAKKWLANDKEYYIMYANTMDSLIHKEITMDDMSIGSYTGYSNELFFIYYLMASIGYGQIILQHPELKEKYLPSMEYCIDKMMTEEVMAFDTDAWGENALSGLRAGTEEAHGAFFNYFNVAIGLHNLIQKNSKYKGLNDSISNHLIKKMLESKYRIIETYPNDYYPADMSAAYGSLGIYQKASGKKLPGISREIIWNFQSELTDSVTGLVFHQIFPENGILHKGSPRGASTAYSAYFLSFLDEDFSRKIFNSIIKNLYENKGLFAGIREYPRGVTGLADGDSGPIVLGLGVTATGFTIPLAKLSDDKEVFINLYNTAAKVGGATFYDNKFEFSRGEFIGNSIMFAMLTSF